MLNKNFEVVQAFLNTTNEDTGNESNKKWFYVVPPICFGVLLFVIIVLATRKCTRKEEKNKGSVFSISQTSISDQNSEDYIYQPVYKNHRNPIYLVPYSALPQNFDFSRNDIVVKGDYIIVKDLLILEQPVIRPPTTPPCLEEYKKQSPFNPNFYY